MIDSSSSSNQQSKPLESSSTMADRRRSNSDQAKRRRLDTAGSSHGRTANTRPQRLFLPFNTRLCLSRRLFSETSQHTGDQTKRHHNDDAAIRYNHLRLWGFLLQGYINPKDHCLDDALTIIGNVGWSYTVLLPNPFCPNVVREFISNKAYDGEEVLIRGHNFQFTPEVIIQLMMAPSPVHAFDWQSVHLNEAITFLTGGHCSEWNGFNLKSMVSPYKTLYRVCELNWIPGRFSESLMKQRIRLLYAVAKRKEVNFGEVVYDQVIEMVRVSRSYTEIIFPNLIYTVLLLQKDIPVLPVDEGLTGNAFPIFDHEGDTSGPRGSSRMC